MQESFQATEYIKQMFTFTSVIGKNRQQQLAIKVLRFCSDRQLSTSYFEIQNQLWRNKGKIK